MIPANLHDPSTREGALRLRSGQAVCHMITQEEKSALAVERASALLFPV
jgi:hypothetical protein